MKEIVTYYNILEEFFMLQSFKKAISMDTLDDNSKTTSFVDSTFFVLKQSAQRALSSLNMNSACSMINMVQNTLNIDYKQVRNFTENSLKILQLLEEMLRESFENPHAMNAKVVLNNVEVCHQTETRIGISSKFPVE
jgi:hypothetical protein